MKIKPKEDIIFLGIKIFLIGLLLQFFLHTLFTFQFKLTGSFFNIIWAWKELFIIIALIFILYTIIKKYKKGIKGNEKEHEKVNSKRKEERKKKGYILQFINQLPLKLYIGIFCIAIIIILGISLKTSNIINGIISIRYSMIGFLIFIIANYIGYFFFNESNIKRIFIRQKKLIQSILILGLLWRGIIRLIPKSISIFGYNEFSHEGTVGESPPIAYQTEYNRGLTRNQFIFERPITYGFFLIAFWPLFFMLAIRNKKNKALLVRGGLYCLNIFSTFSRAAWGAWIIQTIILLLFLDHKKWKKGLIYFISPIFLGVGIISYFAADQITHRKYSNTGHINEIKLALKKIERDPLWGAGVGSAGPASHHIKEFKPYNTENQYLQIWVEYGILGLLLWLLLYGFLHYIGIIARKENKKKKQLKKYTKINDYIIAFAIGILGISIENLVLHAFVDRMVVYPFMLLFGIIYGINISQKKNITTKK